MKPDNSLLEAALIGFRAQLSSIQTRIGEIQAQLGGKPKHAMSAEGRRRIAAGQRKRWAEAKARKESANV